MDKNDYNVIDISKLVKFLNEKGVSRKCALCNHETLQYSEKAYTVPVTNKENDILKSQLSAIFAPLVCTNCGNTLFINAIKFDLLLPKDTEIKEVDSNDLD